jgi:hypothetical protein
LPKRESRGEIRCGSSGRPRKPDAAVDFDKPPGSRQFRESISWSTDLQRFMAKRMGAKTIEVKASHLSPISQPDTIANLILEAAGQS